MQYYSCVFVAERLKAPSLQLQHWKFELPSRNLLWGVLIVTLMVGGEGDRSSGSVMVGDRGTA